MYPKCNYHIIKRITNSIIAISLIQLQVSGAGYNQYDTVKPSTIAIQKNLEDTSTQFRVGFTSLFTVNAAEVKRGPLQYELNEKAISFIQTYMDKQGAGLRKMKTWAKPYFNLYDVILESEDYTLGKALEYILYEKYYNGDKILSFCGFKKFHPHNDDSTLRLAFLKPADKRIVGQYLKNAAIDAKEVFKNVYGLF